jgi:Cys-rich protein (TIGR01571 family)
MSKSDVGNKVPHVSELPLGKTTNSPSTFLYGMCVCCADCDSCLEAYCCSRCQVSRQCNMMKTGEPEIDWLYCVGAWLLDYCFTGGIAGCVFVCQSREMIRRRYGIAGSPCRDCCLSFCCTYCVLQQQLLEMISRGEFPGACCYEAPKSSPGAADMM